MKRFSKKIAILVLVVIALSFFLDSCYTYIYSNSQPRSKVQYVMQLENETYDAIFLGSSRIENHIKTSLFNKKKLKALNLGMSGANLNEVFLVLKLLKAKNIKAKSIFIQIDYNFEYQTPSKGITAMFMPFINDPIISEHYSKYQDKFWQYKHIPFYRYISHESKIGVREITMNVLSKSPKINAEDGYMPLYHTMKNGEYSLPNEASSSNSVFNEIENFKNKHGINIIYFTAPFCVNTKNLDYIDKLKKQHIPTLHNYSNSIKKDKLFSSCGHLNNEGAELFTNTIINDFYGR